MPIFGSTPLALHDATRTSPRPCAAALNERARLVAQAPVPYAIGRTGGTRMLEKLARVPTDDESRDLALLGGGMLGIMTGATAVPLAMSALGARGLERHWLKAHPDFQGDLRERWEHAIELYDVTHRDPINRVLHTVGFP